ncbi:hypothetical protein CBW53_03105 [Yersinia frederiksenii]|nr:hypothetical protein CBW53_03105 [Yersinia frederiksenii]CNI69150.1 Uncharacterised protein [Yersinia frederiksenii]
MSETARWSYQALATIYPLIRVDTYNNINEYGEPYLIDCTYKSEIKTVRDKNGNELVSMMTFFTEFYHEDERVRTAANGDYISIGNKLHILEPVEAAGSEIIAVLEEDMSAFDEEPDFKVIT